MPLVVSGDATHGGPSLLLSSSPNVSQRGRKTFVCRSPWKMSSLLDSRYYLNFKTKGCSR